MPTDPVSFTTKVDGVDTVFAADVNNLQNAVINQRNFKTQATAAGTTTLDVTSEMTQAFTGASTQTIVMPVTSTLYVGKTYRIINNSTGKVTVNSSGSNLIKVVQAGATANIVCSLITGTTAASWIAIVYPFAGTYTPTLTNQTNIAASTAYVNIYSVVDNTVTVSGQVDIDPTAAGTCVLRMSVPFTGNFTTLQQAGGTGVRIISAGLYEPISIYSRSTTALIEFAFTAANTANQQCNFTFTYQIQ